MIVPGRILVIDDAPTPKEKRKVNKLVNSLREKGESVLFAPSMPEKETLLDNVRLLIIDLLLAGEDRDASYEMVTGILEKLSQKTMFFIIAVWTKVARNTEKDKHIIQALKEMFEKRTEDKIRAVFLEPFGKNLSPRQLISSIEKSMAARPECGLLFETERSIENARDHAVSDIIATAEVPVILRTLKEELSDVALNRQMIDLYLKILGRHCEPTETMVQCIKKLVSQSTPIISSKYGQIHNLQSYYNVPQEETIWTGDIIERKNRKGQYAVIITPTCDFAQRKRRPLDFVKLVHSAMRIDHDKLDDKTRFKEAKVLLNISKNRKLKDFKGLILSGGLRERFYVLKYLRDGQNAVLFHLILDFQRVSMIGFKERVKSLGGGGWDRICRIDTPLIENLLQKYSVYSSRIGIPSIPRDLD